MEEGFNKLPEDCIANILSFTSPRDACRLSLVSSTFRSAAQSDAVWNRFLPSDLQTLLPQSFPSRKHLYLHLCQNPLLIDHGQKSVQLVKVNGKKCFMISARCLFIVWGDTPRYWKWTSLPDVRFSEVAELVMVCWLEIRGRINTGMLSSETLYGAYLVFKQNPEKTFGFHCQAVEVSIEISGVETSKRTVYLDAGRGRRPRYDDAPRGGMFNRALFLSTLLEATPAEDNNSSSNNNNINNSLGVLFPKERGDGWKEVELGDFFNDGKDDKEVEIGIHEIKSGQWKGGLFVQGIELRPKTVPIN